MARPKDPRSVYFDSNALIAAVKKEPRHEPVTAILGMCDIGRLTVVVSTLSYVEVRGHGKTGKPDPQVESAVMTLLDKAAVLKVQPTRRVALAARRLTVAYRLENYDAVHLASAVEAQAEVFMTWDGDFKALKGTSFEGVWIDEPYEPGDPSLFTT